MNLEQLTRMHRDEFGRIVELLKHLPYAKTADLIQAGYEGQEMEKIYDDLRKEMKKYNAILQKLLCHRWITADGPPQISTNGVTAMPNPKHVPTLPKPTTEEYIALASSLGVPEELLHSDLVRINWPTFAEAYHQLVAEGKPLPEGCLPEKESVQYKVNFQMRKGQPDG